MSEFGDVVEEAGVEETTQFGQERAVCFGEVRLFLLGSHDLPLSRA